jgi:RimJ/RimL family protein N-acetyltransferase
MIEPVTDRLLLRTWRPEDREPFAAMNADAAVMEFFPGLMSRAQSDAFADVIEDRFAAQGFGLWALELRATGKFIGFTGLNPMPDGVPGEGGMEVGWRLARQAWKHGYATEAARAALQVAFVELELPEVWSMTAPQNLPSRAVMERIGLIHVADADHPRAPARLNPHVFYRIRRDAWGGATMRSP